MKIKNPQYTTSKRFPNMVVCKNCAVNFDLERDAVFTKSSKDCKGHEFSIPKTAEIYEIDEPVFFIRKK